MKSDILHWFENASVKLEHIPARSASVHSFQSTFN